MSLLSQTTVFLAAAVVAVPIFKRLGLGAVLGYLAAGIAIGPWGGMGLVTDVESESILHFSELGVVLLLFIIGLELQPSRLWVLRRSVFGLGSAQVLISGAVLGLAGMALGLPTGTAIIAGLALSLSSTAFALQILAEKNQLTTRHGRVAFSILLFQDLAVVPLLAIVPLLGASDLSVADSNTWLSVGKVVLVLALVVGAGRYVLRYALRLVAATGIHEVFTAMALLTVIGIALLMEQVGLSMALGAFLAGVLLADSEYRHALEADIEPFKGLLLGLFFISVGMSVNIGLLLNQATVVFSLALGAMLAKGLVLFLLGKTTGLSGFSARNLAVTLPQGGEFAFVIFGVAVASGVMDRDLSELLIVTVTVSMALTPVFFLFNEKILNPRLRSRDEDSYEQPVPEDNQVIIAGFGRFGQIVARILRAKKIGFTALDISSEQVDFVAKYGNKIYYGDASRLELLRAARADRAVIFVLAIDDVTASVRAAETVVKNFPHLKVYARARNRKHAYQLMDLGLKVIWRETYLSSLDMADAVLQGLGLADYESDRVVQKFKEHDEHRLYAHHSIHTDEEKMRDLAKKAAKELEELFEQDATEGVGS